MQRYLDYSADIYGIYLRYISSEDIHVYSIDEVFMDVTDYLKLYDTDALALAGKILDEVYRMTGITAVCGIGSNLYLAKVALDILAKHAGDGIAYLDEALYRERLWHHRPMTDFWRIGNGTVKRLENAGIFTMEDITKADEKLLYRLFGVDAELLIDHAWGRECVTMPDIKNYKAKSHSVSSGQVLPRDYTYEECQIIVKEMADVIGYELLEQNVVTDSLSLYIGYSNQFPVSPVRGTISMPVSTNSQRIIMEYALRLYERIVDKSCLIRRITLSCNHVVSQEYEQYNLFMDPAEMERDRRLQASALQIKRRYGKNALVRGMDLLECATTLERNRQIGGHKSGS